MTSPASIEKARRLVEEWVEYRNEGTGDWWKEIPQFIWDDLARRIAEMVEKAESGGKPAPPR